MIHKAKKSLGQNFLKSNLALKKIIEAGEISPDDIILEIGPGKGALTEKLLEKAGCVIAIEKDRDLFQFLQEKFDEEISEKKLILLEEDILEFNISKILQSIISKTAHIRVVADCYARTVGLRNAFIDNTLQNLKENAGQNILERTLGRSAGDGQRKSSAEDFRGESESVLSEVDSKKNILSEPKNLNYKIIANIPYNITGAILKKFLTEKDQPTMMVLMVQNEVAKRIVANDKKESILSISVKAYGEPKMIMKVPARYFSPAPKVDSAIIAIKNISRKLFEENKINEAKFWEIIHAGFAHKRKKLSGNLKKIIKNLPEETKNKRAEDLTLQDWIELAKN